jgi:perosamine synthetase
VSSATSVLHARATPVFADVDPETFTLDPVDVARRLTKRTKAILAVHYGGQPADVADLAALAQDCGAVLIEDAAQAHGACYRGRPVGALGRAGMFSFTPTKNITTGEGGVVTTDDARLASDLRLLRDHGQNGLPFPEMLGYNWRLSEIQAAMGSVQLRKLDAILERKWANAAWFAERLRGARGVRLPVVRPDRTHVYMLYTLVADHRDALLAALVDAGIETRIYFQPLHQLPVFDRGAPALPVTEELSRRILSVPFHSKLDRNDLEEIAGIIEHAR